MRSPLTIYGKREWLTISCGALAACALILLVAYRTADWALVFLAPVLLIWGWTLWFFRDPQRDPERDGAVLLSAADGVVADITQVGKDSPLGCSGVSVGVFMNVFNVHVNRSPYSGTVTATEHTSGAFLDARDPHASTKNESATITMKVHHNGKEYPLIVRQIAGLVARRIVTAVHEGDAVGSGERIGMIKFGSRVEVIAPDELVEKVCVEIGQKTFAGQTVLMDMKPSSETSEHD